jgi:hypothetical protein
MKRFDPITYRYPRSVNEASPNTVDYASAFEPHIDMNAIPKADRVVVGVCLVAGVAVAVLAVLRALPGGAV